MARLPSQRYLMQQIGLDVILFEEGTEREIVRYDPADAVGSRLAQLTISQCPDLDDQDRAMAHFWAGYFYAHSGKGQT